MTEDKIQITFYHVSGDNRQEHSVPFDRQDWEAMSGAERMQAALDAALHNGLEVGYRVDG